MMHTSATMNGAEDHQGGSTMMTTRSLPVDTLGRLKHWWPSQAYHCTFCTRVFRTAQALGGHMNIHRRERAYVSTTPIIPPSRQLPQLLTPAPSSSRPAALQPSQQLQIAAFLTKQQGAPPRPGSCNGGYGKLDLVVDATQPSTISDPLTWLFSQLPPPRPPPPRMQSANPVLKPFHRGLMVCKSPPGVRRHVCRIHTSPLALQSHVLYTGMMQSRTRGLVGSQYSTPELRISHGVDRQAPDQEACALDLELRL